MRSENAYAALQLLHSNGSRSFGEPYLSVKVKLQRETNPYLPILNLPRFTVVWNEFKDAVFQESESLSYWSA
jgi:hypothetical protein